MLYLLVDCIDWLLSYAADELHFQGVVPSNLQPNPKRIPNVYSVADLHIELDFTSKTWEGEFVAGPFVGHRKRMSINDIDNKIWTILHEKSLVHGYFSGASLTRKKNAAKEFVTMWCSAITRNEDAIFTALMNAPATPSEPRGKKRSLKHAAVADDADDVAAAVDDTAVAAEEKEEEEEEEEED